MGWVIVAMLVILIISVAITWLVMSAKGHSGRAGARTDEDSGYGAGVPGSDTAIVAADETPMGDTTEHAGEQSTEGHTVEDPESAERGIDPGGEQPAQHSGGPSRPERPEDRQLRDSGAATQSEHLAHRPR